MDWAMVLADIVLPYCPIREAIAISLLNRWCMQRVMKQDPYRKRLVSFVDLGIRMTFPQRDKMYLGYLSARRVLSEGKPCVLFPRLLSPDGYKKNH